MTHVSLWRHYRKLRRTEYVKARARGCSRVGSWFYAYMTSRPVSWPWTRYWL